jgi:hypothetical protein
MSNIVEMKIQAPDNAPFLAAEMALARANAHTISSPAELLGANGELKAIKAKWNEIEATRKSLLGPVDEARARIQALFKPPLDFLARAESIYKGKIAAYQTEERRIAQEAAQREADRLRKLEEAKAVRAEKRGDIERAEQLREQEIIVPVAPTTRLEGTTVRTVWSAELVDIKALCAAIAEGKAPADLVDFSQARGNRIATALKDAANVPGLRFIRSESVAVRA